MNKETFKKHLLEIKSICEDVQGVDSAIRKLDPDFGGFYLSRVEQAMVDILKAAVNDKSDYLGYWIWENNWGEGIKKNSVTDKKGKPIPLKTPEQLYDAIKLYK